ncbi:MAG: hypothetical protein R3C46_13125 [Hyphomonadaceae bacterium]
MKSPRLASAFGAIAALAIAGCTTTQPAAAETSPYAGVYAGSYTCGDGEHGFYLDLSSVTAASGGGFEASGVLGFYPTLSGIGGSSGGVAGSFRVSGTISAAGDVALTAGEWLKQPSGYGAANLEGKLRERPAGGYALVGKPVVPGMPDACSNLIATQFLP